MATEVIVIDSEVYKEQNARLAMMEKLFLNVVNELHDKENERWISVQQVMEYTGFSRQWVMNRKDVLGFFQDGKDLRFWKPDVMSFMSTRAIHPSKKNIYNLKTA